MPTVRTDESDSFEGCGCFGSIAKLLSGVFNNKEKDQLLATPSSTSTVPSLSPSSSPSISPSTSPDSSNRGGNNWGCCSWFRSIKDIFSVQSSKPSPPSRGGWGFFGKSDRSASTLPSTTGWGWGYLDWRKKTNNESTHTQISSSATNATGRKTSL